MCSVSFAMASDLGATPVQVEFVRGAADGGYPIPYRQVWYARYIDWTITTPMLLLELLLTTGLPLSQLFIVRFLLCREMRVSFPGMLAS